MDDIKGKINKFTQALGKTSGDLLKQTKLGITLANEEENLKSLYQEIGKKVHEIYSYGGTLGKYFDEKYIELKEKEKTIADLRDQIDAAKGTKTCPACGKTTPRDSEFCQKCGARLSGTSEAPPSFEQSTEVQTAQPPVHSEASETISGKTCSACGAFNTENSRHCLTCGRVL